MYRLLKMISAFDRVSCMSRRTMVQNNTRRSVLAGTGVTIAGVLGAGSQVIADERNVPVVIQSIDVQTEITVANEGDEDVDLSGYIVNYDWEGERNKEGAIPDGAIIEAGGELALSTGCADTAADWVLGDFGDCRFLDDGFDVVALLSPDREVIDTFSDNGGEEPVPEEEPEEEDESEEEEEEPADDFPQQYEANLTREAHGVETDATGHATFEVDAHEDGMDAHYELTVENICDVTQAHIHLGAEGEDGPVVVWLYPEDAQEPELVEGFFSGTLAEGTITADNFVGEWEGASFEDAGAAFEQRGAYVNVHTEEHPGGEIRGQITPTEEVERPDEKDDETHTVEIEVLSGTPFPIADATVTVDGQTAQTDDEGMVTFELESGSYTVEAMPEGHERGERELTVSEDESLRFVLPRILDEVEIVDHEVFVTEETDGEEVINVRATIENRHDHETGDMLVQSTIYDEDGEEFGSPISGGDVAHISVGPNDHEEVEGRISRAGEGEFTREIGSYEITLSSLEFTEPVDHVQAEYQGE